MYILIYRVKVYRNVIAESKKVYVRFVPCKLRYICREILDIEKCKIKSILYRYEEDVI